MSYKSNDGNFGDVNYFYKDFYSKTIGEDAKGIRAFLSRYPHKLVEKRFKSNKNFSILEIGAGNGEHIPHVRSDYDSYVAIDIRPSSKLQNFTNDKIKVLEGNAEALFQISDSSFDRVLAMCLVAHLNNPENALNEFHRITKDCGLVQIYLPCEPGIALRTFRKLVTAPAVSRMGYRGFHLFMAREHRNSLSNLLVLINHIYKGSEIRVIRRPFPILGWYLNLFYLIEIRIRKNG